MSEMAIDYQRRPITADEFERMGEFGIFAPDERVELIDGEIVLMPPMNPFHFGSVTRLTELFVERLRAYVSVTPQLPLRISRLSEPQPDFGLLRRSDDFYATRAATVDDIIAVIECADSSLRYDRGKKLLAYARAGIGEYWIVNLNERRIETHRKPHELGYRARVVAMPGETIAFEAIAAVTFTVDEILGPPAGG